MQTHQLDLRIRRMIETLRELRIRSSVPVEPIEAALRDSNDFTPFANGAEWGADAQHDWMDFRFRAVVPDGFSGKVTLSIQTGREKLWEAINPQFEVWVDGRLEQAFDSAHTSLTLQSEAAPGSAFDVLLRGYANSFAPNLHERPAAPPRLRVLLNDVCADVEQLIYDLDVPYQALLLEAEGCRDREQTAFTLSDALNLLDLRNPYSASFHVSVADARAFLRERYYAPLAAVAPEACAEIIGHTHIDVAWLWDLEQTRHKAVRSFATMLKLMEQYPEFKFMSSQAQLYQFVKEDQPELFERIRQAVAQGRWEVEGGMWVEADCNLTGGESLVRQLLYGNEFFEAEFGKRSRILWLPDVFGYSAALPQILKKSGIDYFFTSKLSWSEFNLMPYDSFLWKGIDGSEVLTHFTPTRDYSGANAHEKHEDLSYFTTYNAMITPTQLKGAWQRFQQKGIDNHFLVTYGYGDGGGGSTDWMIENARRMKNPVAGLPAVRQQFALDFFEGLEKRVMGNRRLPKWSGELYLEYHRGTYTAMARNKRSNRKIEIELRETELWRECASRRAGLPYPNDALRELWRQVLTLQFHDILPGSSIQKVYEDSKASYERLFGELKDLKKAAFDALGAGLGGDLLVYNSLDFPRTDVVWFDADEGVCALADAAGRTYPVQRVEGRACACVEDLPPMSATPFRFVCGAPEPAAMEIDDRGFVTPFFSGKFDGAMRIASLTDLRSRREVVRPGQALNRIVCYENRPHNYDAWDINIYYDERFWEVDELLSSEIVSSGAVLTKIRNTYRVNRSRIVQDVVFYRDIPRIDFQTRVDWKEAHCMLKAHFPVDLFYNEATYDIQYGNVRRPTHKNTSWDVARFEVCAHKWMDVSEGDSFGFSLMNDCKYGHSAGEDGIALTLLKGSTSPNPTADQETHRFTYSIMPHEGGWRRANVPRMAYRLNIPLTAVAQTGGRAGAAPCGGMEPFVRTDARGVIVESVKRALRGEGTVIRLYECFGERAHVRLELGFPFRSISRASLMEDALDALPSDGGCVELDLKPYEIETLLIL